MNNAFTDYNEKLAKMLYELYRTLTKDAPVKNMKEFYNTINTFLESD